MVEETKHLFLEASSRGQGGDGRTLCTVVSRCYDHSIFSKAKNNHNHNNNNSINHNKLKAKSVAIWPTTPKISPSGWEMSNKIIPVDQPSK